MNTFAADFVTPENDYLANLRVIVRLGYVESKFWGLAVSLLSAYLREQDQLRQRERKADSQYVGVVGQRSVFDGLGVVSLRAYDGNYGVTTRIEFINADGCVLIWWASGHPALSQGDTVSIKATVKKQEGYKGVRQTTITRGVVQAQ